MLNRSKFGGRQKIISHDEHYTALNTTTGTNNQMEVERKSYEKLLKILLPSF